jgi:hypothetical protein
MNAVGTTWTRPLYLEKLCTSNLRSGSKPLNKPEKSQGVVKGIYEKLEPGKCGAEAVFEPKPVEFVEELSPISTIFKQSGIFGK